MVEWVQTHETVLLWLTVASIITFMGTLIAVPLLVVRIPSNYFAHGKHHWIPLTDRHSLVGGVLLIGKNVVGYVFIVVGIAMLVIPGPGVLTILIGIMLLNLPGKYRLERWIVARRPVIRSINWLRRRAGSSPLVLEESSRSEEPSLPMAGQGSA